VDRADVVVVLPSFSIRIIRSEGSEKKAERETIVGR